ncbi:MAG: methyltransferase domain-containing protein [Candidatus Berkelbacteria bacterium]|nr:methyltransferase domain-containing protein [Candidatus Berkelbacteria bacterium]
MLPFEETSSVFKHDPELFTQTIYGGALGNLRIASLLSDLLPWIDARPDLTTILDLGAGHAPMTLELLKQRPNLRAILVDPSAELLRSAEERQASLGIPAASVERIVDSVPGVFPKLMRTRIDLILCHAVVNWVDEPVSFLHDLVDFCEATGADVSLVFGSTIGKALRFVRNGSLTEALNSAQTVVPQVPSLLGDHQVRPLDPDYVAYILHKRACRLHLKAGVRVFADLAPPGCMDNEHDLAKLAALERATRRRRSYWRLGQLVHFVFSSQFGLQGEMSAQLSLFDSSQLSSPDALPAPVTPEESFEAATAIE